MKYFYTTLFLLLSIAASSQNLYWIGGASGNWNNTANWSLSSGGASAGTVPAASNYAVFNTSAEVNFDVASTSITGLHILNGSNVKLVASDNATLTVTSTNASAASTGLYVAENSTLTDSMTAYPAGIFTLQFANNAKGTVDGMLVTTGDPGTGALPDVGKSRIAFNPPGGANSNPLLTINGTYKQMNGAGATGLTATQIGFWEFTAGSTHWVNSLTGGNIGPATYDDNSTIHIGGNINTMPVFSTNMPGIGNVVVDIVSYGGQINNLTLVFPNNIAINGDLTFRRTAGSPLLIAGPTVSNSLLRANNDVIIEAPAQVAIGSYNDHASTLEVGGNFIMTGGTLLFRKTPTAATTYTTPTVLKVLGNIQQTDGSITTGNVTVSAPEEELFVIEMAGTTAQTISATGGDWDNALQNVVLRMNNASGVTLGSNVRVSKVSWNSANKGVITTSTGAPLTILNPSTTDVTVMNQAGAPAAYVDGPVRRVTNANAAYVFPTGDNGVYRPTVLVPEDGSPAVFEAQYWNQAYANLNTSPIMSGVSDQEYWRAARTSGTTNASVRLSLNGIVPGTTTTDGLVVASYTGSQWVSEYAGTAVSNILVPGNTDEGSVQTEYSSLGRYYTFGFGTAATLPIELTKFNVSKLNNNQASVEWVVTAESTPVSFIVERSTDGVQFAAIATVTATTATQYQYIDTELPSGKIYYRLRMIDQDGSAKYSDIQFIQVSNNSNKIQLYPTVTSAQTNVKIDVTRSSRITVVVSDNSGRIIQRNAHSVNAGSQVITLNVATLSNGVYYVVVIYEDGSTAAPHKFIKQ